MAVTLQLKKRLTNHQLSIPKRVLDQKLVEDGDKPGSLAQFFVNGIGTAELPDAIHDKIHLELIAHWQPEGGLPVREDVKWLGLRQRISQLDDSREGPFTINTAQAELIWKRLKDERFKGGRGEQWSAFLLDYLAATHNVFEDVGPDLLDDADLDDTAVPAVTKD